MIRAVSGATLRAMRVSSDAVISDNHLPNPPPRENSTMVVDPAARRSLRSRADKSQGRLEPASRQIVATRRVINARSIDQQDLRG
jgi:hypothetical protein